MGADISRIRVNPLLDYAGVELKQGGVVLDSDFNEHVALTDRRLRALAADVLGRSTVPSTTPEAFKIGVAAGTLSIAKGRLYVDGLLADNHGASSTDPAKKLFDPLLAEVSFADAIAYGAQPYLPVPPPLPEAGRHLVYLDVWQREVTHLERPGLVELAVGVETSSRLQTVWQVRVLDTDAGSATCEADDEDIEGWAELIAQSTGRLTTGTFEVPPEEDPCELPPTGGYRGLENQTYRVEIHDPGQPGGTATFKWSRENASIGSRIASMISGNELELQTLGRDDVLRLNSGDWVEITDDVRELSQRAGEMRQITVKEGVRRITFDGALPADMLPGAFPDNDFPASRNLRVRRWDQKRKVLQTGAGGATSVFQDLDATGTRGVINVPPTGTTLILENGVTVRFASAGAKGFSAGDHWVFAARTADASVEALVDEPPRGIYHHYERLGFWDVGARTVTDCRHPWPPRVEGQDCSCTACVTAESHASGRFTIQDAVNQVRENGGTVCLGGGQYALREPVRLVNTRSVRIRGQGPATVVVGPGGVFVLQACVAVAVENLSVVSLGRQSAVTVRTALGLELKQLVLAVLGSEDARGAAISLEGVVADAAIRENFIIGPFGVLANDPVAVPPGGDASAAGFLLAASLTIERNAFWCRRQGINLAGNVLHMLSTRIDSNEAFGCADFAVSALGMGAPGSSMRVSRNQFNITGSGFRCGVDGLWVEGNKLVNSAREQQADTPPTAGITVASGLDRNGPDQCHVLSNQVIGFSQGGIVIAAPTRELIVKSNIVEDCGNGIVSTENARAASVSIENNHLRNIGPSVEGRNTAVAAIGVRRADTATIRGNTVRTVGAQTRLGAFCAGIHTLGVMRAHVSGNEVTEIAPPRDFGGVVAGILLRAPFRQFEVSHNHVERDTSASTQPVGGTRLALIAADIDPRNPLARIGNLTTLRVDNTRVLVMGGGRAYVASLAVAAAADGIDQARGSVIGNVLNARGGMVAQVSAAGECLFNDNQVDSQANTSIAVILSTTVAIVSANRVRGGDLSIQVLGTKSAAVLGNITTGSISVPGGLQPPWDALNLHA